MRSAQPVGQIGITRGVEAAHSDRIKKTGRSMKFGALSGAEDRRDVIPSPAVSADTPMPTTSIARVKWTARRSGYARRVRARHRSSQGQTAILNQVSRDQRRGKEDEAEDEVAEKAMPFASSNTSRPKGDSHPDQEEHDTSEPPATWSDEHLDLRLCSFRVGLAGQVGTSVSPSAAVHWRDSVMNQRHRLHPRQRSPGW